MALDIEDPYPVFRLDLLSYTDPAPHLPFPLAPDVTCTTLAPPGERRGPSDARLVSEVLGLLAQADISHV